MPLENSLALKRADFLYHQEIRVKISEEERMVLGDAAWFPSWEEFNKILNYEEKSDYQKVVEGLVPLGKSLPMTALPTSS